VNQRSGEEDNKRKQAVMGAGRNGYRGGKLSAWRRSFRGKQADKNRDDSNSKG